MSKRKTPKAKDTENTIAADEVIVDVEEVLSSTEVYIEENKNTLTTVVLALLVIVGGYFAYTNLYQAPLEKEASEQLWKAEQYFETDSFRLAINGDNQYPGFAELVDNYGSTKAGNLATYYLGISYLKLGEYQNAIDQLEGFSSDDKMIAPTAKGATATAYLELDNKDKALKLYKEAASMSDNTFTAPIFLMKAGFVAELLGKKEEAISLYEKLKANYPSTSEARDADKYIARLGKF